MSNEEQRENIEALVDIKEQIEVLLDEAKYLLYSAPDGIRNRAKSYWYAHMRTALSDDNEFIGRSMCSMQNTIDEWSGRMSEDETEEADCDCYDCQRSRDARKECTNG